LENFFLSSFLLFETVHLECHQQRSSPSKCTRIVGGWGFCPRPHWELTEREGEEVEGREGEREWRGREGLWTLTMLETD